MCWHLLNLFLSPMSVRQLFTHRHLTLRMSQIKFVFFPPQFSVFLTSAGGTAIHLITQKLESLGALSYHPPFSLPHPVDENIL